MQHDAWVRCWKNLCNLRWYTIPSNGEARIFHTARTHSCAAVLQHHVLSFIGIHRNLMLEVSSLLSRRKCFSHHAQSILPPGKWNGILKIAIWVHEHTFAAQPEVSVRVHDCEQREDWLSQCWTNSHFCLEQCGLPICCHSCNGNDCCSIHGDDILLSIA